MKTSGPCIFLSAGMPDQSSKNFVRPARTVNLVSAIASLSYVILGRRRLIWGGHPAITPMISTIAQNIDVSYIDSVTLYQSKFFEDEFPDEVKDFENVVLIDSVGNSREKSLFEMRHRMFSENDIESSVFIGGMSGIIEEFEILGKIHPETKKFAVGSTGGAAELILEEAIVPDKLRKKLQYDIDYIPLFHEILEIDFDEPRANLA